MDISTIKPPAEKTEGEPHANASQGSDQAFLQLLAGLGLLQPIQPKLILEGKSEAMSGGVSRESDAAPVEKAGSTAITADQEMMTAGKINDAAVFLAQSIQASQNGTTAVDLLAHVLTSAGTHENDHTATDPAQAGAVGGKDSSAIGHALAAEEKTPLPVTSLPEIKEAPQNTPQATSSKDAPQNVLNRLMDVLSAGHGPKERESASAAPSVSTGSQRNAQIQSLVDQDMPVKQNATSGQTMIWNAVTQPSNLLESGKDNNSASADHNGSKERFPQAEGGASQAASAPGTSSFSPQPSPATARPSASVDAPTVTAPLESTLPASVRFEVQQGDMGRIRVHVSIVDHTVYTNVMTERVEAHDFLVKGSERYEAGLAAHGLDVGRFQVDVQGQNREHADRGGTAWSQEQTPRRREEPPNNAVMAWHSEERTIEREDRMVNVFA